MPKSNFKDVPADKLISAYAEFLKTSEFAVPEWVDIVKTAAYKELPPTNPDWYYIRAAAILRRVACHAGIGVGALKLDFGGKEKHRTSRNKLAFAAGGVIRHIIGQFKEMGLICEGPTGKGCMITGKGRSQLDGMVRKI